MSITTRASTIGFIGLGAMGFPMAINLYAKSLAAGRACSEEGRPCPPPSLVICEVNDASAEAFIAAVRTQMGPDAAERVTHVSKPSEVARLASRIVTMLPATPHVEAVYLGPDGLLAGLELAPNKTRTLAAAAAACPWILGSEALPPAPSAAHTLLIDGTTLDPVAAKRVAATVRQRTGGGALMVDCPVSGGIPGATAGTLTMMLGSDDDFATTLARGLMQLTARPGGVVYCGGNGAGIGTKVCNNMVLTINQLALAEGLALGRALGLDAGMLHEVFNSSSAQSWSSRVYSPLPEVEGSQGWKNYDEGFPTMSIIKDVKLALGAAGAVSLPTPMAFEALDVYTRMSQYDGGKFAAKDFSVSYKWLNELQAGSAAANGPTVNGAGANGTQ